MSTAYPACLSSPDRTCILRACTDRSTLAIYTQPVSQEVRAQFGRFAANYASSYYCADPARLEEVMVLCQPRPSDLALDVATGTGHTALALSDYVEQAVGLDITPEMLDQARRLAGERQVTNLELVRGDARQLPFPSRLFDLYTVRAAPHHFERLEEALNEAARVLKPRGRACFIDPSPPLAARDLLHEIEMERDPSHIRCYTTGEWAAMLEAAGLEVEFSERREYRWDFEAWMRVTDVQPDRVARLAEVIESASGSVRDEIRPERENDRLFHRYWYLLIRARKLR
jgi:ubiquinone/menaquinone biosynthesis C-methylase UbiE